MTLQWFALDGRSMWPLAAPWQVGLGSCGEQLYIGDLLAVVGDRPATVVVHRLVAIDGDRLILRGDSNGYYDAPVARSALVGRVKAVRLGYLRLTDPENPMLSMFLRRSGLAWSRLAPVLRLGLRRLRGRHRGTRQNIDMVGD